ncbi:hypothetical protein SZN_28588 [Streptomyces zinciresistens K42]|uniref:Lipoprotein n=1 Tax=Streptomyces zinciresistens K42 TaxID=700597 RepID=G2GJM5_9ACTN|nr:hypothetical protein [Streptomyces zinciresistens]EGX56283.1 hypothetical protein SZN_28588 [Streptomyces zinciresistens K42]
MPYSLPPRAPSGPRRRTLLASAAGAALLAGCSSGPDDPDGGTSGSPSLAERARARAARDSEDLVARYDAVLTAYPVLAESVGPLRAVALRHAQAFGAGTPKPSGSSSPAAGPTASAGVSSPAVPGSERDALSALAAAERGLADRRAAALLGVPGELARLLASVAAAGAAHAFLLTEGAR